MEAQRNEILELAEKNGWKCREFDNYDSQAWTFEVWKLESVWSPVGLTAYVSLLIDQMSNDFRNPDVWAIEVSEEEPFHGKSRDGFVVSLKQWSKEKEKFFNYLAEMRDRKIRSVEDKK